MSCVLGVQISASQKKNAVRPTVQAAREARADPLVDFVGEVGIAILAADASTDASTARTFNRKQDHVCADARSQWADALAALGLTTLVRGTG